MKAQAAEENVNALLRGQPKSRFCCRPQPPKPDAWCVIAKYTCESCGTEWLWTEKTRWLPAEIHRARAD